MSENTTEWGSTSIACVIPTHNRDELLREAILSVLTQTSRPASITVVDDAGSESARALVAELAEDSALPIAYVANRDPLAAGASGSRNLGARSRESAFIAFLDDDDLWAPEFLEECLAALRDSDADMAVTWTDMSRGTYRGEGLRIRETATVAEALNRNPGLTGSNFVIKRRVFEAVEFDPNFYVANDRDFLIRFLDSGHSYVAVTKPLVIQRAHDQGQLTSRTERRARGLETFLARYADRMTRSDKRELQRIVHSIRRVSAESPAARFRHLVLQLLKDSPVRFIRAAQKRFRGRPTIYR